MNSTDNNTKPQQEIMDKIKQPFDKFFRSESSSGLLLLFFTILALILANTALSNEYFKFWDIHLKIGIGDFVLDKPIHLWINDGLMAIFFFVVGLEIKREIMVGELSTIKVASLPIGAAIGGMAIPAIIYTIFNLGQPGESGWGIPMATDIAFALGILSLLGKRVPLSLKIFLVALAIIDDLGAVLVIALFYSSDLSGACLITAGIILAILFIINRLKIRQPIFYVILGLALWIAFLKSGIHTTVAGVLLAITIPSSTKINRADFIRKTKFYLEKFRHACGMGKSILTNQGQQEAVQSIEIACHNVESPMQRLEHILHPWVIFGIMPLFAFANAGITLDSNLLNNLDINIILGIIFGLTIGKPLGLFLFSYLFTKLKIARLPDDVNWKQLIGTGFLAGIGFTMSLFINGLAFSDSGLVSSAKIGILVASILSGVIGWILLKISTPPK